MSDRLRKLLRGSSDGDRCRPSKVDTSAALFMSSRVCGSRRLVQKDWRPKPNDDKPIDQTKDVTITFEKDDSAKEGMNENQPNVLNDTMQVVGEINNKSKGPVDSQSKMLEEGLQEVLGEENRMIDEGSIMKKQIGESRGGDSRKEQEQGEVNVGPTEGSKGVSSNATPISNPPFLSSVISSFQGAHKPVRGTTHAETSNQFQSLSE
ncbi:hypothetical protein L6452_37112 [Arctium lappa]|uniref:Uncharacterized protein n=1 Tax=Arctium lappa TaxID=4217 RepID=A0ACB8Y2T7_ARCLA|nr:hypothetical protein L6452_37112 [Arctium lappa]